MCTLLFIYSKNSPGFPSMCGILHGPEIALAVPTLVEATLKWHEEAARVKISYHEYMPFFFLYCTLENPNKLPHFLNTPIPSPSYPKLTLPTVINAVALTTNNNRF